jgi:inhibitor of cysteine peptidase
MLLLRLIAIVIVGLLYSCSAEPSPIRSNKRLTEGDTGRSIELHIGDNLEVTLPGNPTTGFQWEVSAVNTAILRSTGEPIFEPSSSAVGGGGRITFRFEAVGIGQTGLTLNYHRPFEKDVPPVETFEVTVIVR